MRAEVTRHVAADPASVALLLAEPTAEQDPDRGWVVTPPRRAGVGFTALVHSSALAAFSASGEVTIQPAIDAGCDVRLVVAVADDSQASKVERSAGKFLALLANRAKSRSYAA